MDDILTQAPKDKLTDNGPAKLVPFNVQAVRKQLAGGETAVDLNTNQTSFQTPIDRASLQRSLRNEKSKGAESEVTTQTTEPKATSASYLVQPSSIKDTLLAIFNAVRNPPLLISTQLVKPLLDLLPENNFSDILKGLNNLSIWVFSGLGKLGDACCKAIYNDPVGSAAKCWEVTKSIFSTGLAVGEFALKLTGQALLSLGKNFLDHPLDTALSIVRISYNLGKGILDAFGILDFGAALVQLALLNPRAASELALSGAGKLLSITGLPMIWAGLKSARDGNYALAIGQIGLGFVFLSTCWTGAPAIASRAVLLLSKVGLVKIGVSVASKEAISCLTTGIAENVMQGAASSLGKAGLESAIDATTTRAVSTFGKLLQAKSCVTEESFAQCAKSLGPRMFKELGKTCELNKHIPEAVKNCLLQAKNLAPEELAAKLMNCGAKDSSHAWEMAKALKADLHSPWAWRVKDKILAEVMEESLFKNLSDQLTSKVMASFATRVQQAALGNIGSVNLSLKDKLLVPVTSHMPSFIQPWIAKLGMPISHEVPEGAISKFCVSYSKSSGKSLADAAKDLGTLAAENTRTSFDKALRVCVSKGVKEGFERFRNAPRHLHIQAMGAVGAKAALDKVQSPEAEAKSAPDAKHIPALAKEAYKGLPKYRNRADGDMIIHEYMPEADDQWHVLSVERTSDKQTGEPTTMERFLGLVEDLKTLPQNMRKMLSTQSV